MTTTNSEYNMDDVLTIAMNIGEYMLKCGAEVWRVEDTISRISHAYGCTESDVFSITSMIVATNLKNTATVTQSRRIHSYSYNLKQLEDLNALSREICNTKPDPSTVNLRINGIIAEDSIHVGKKFFGYLLGAFGFTIFLAEILLTHL